jgi:ribosomal protein L40E
MCGAENKEGDVRCVSCDAALPSSERRPPPPPEASEHLVCFNCGAENEPGNTLCSRCQTPLPKASTNAAVLDEETGQLICLSCGAENDPDNESCINCSVHLPSADQRAAAALSGIMKNVPEGGFNGRYQQFVTACDKVRKGQWGPLELAQWLQEMHSILSQRAGDFVAVVQTCNYQVVQPHEVESCFAGMEDYENGMQEIWKFIDCGDVSRLDAGLETIWEGNRKINQAIQLNRDFRRGLDTG